MASIKVKILVGFVITILATSMGLYTGFRNTHDYGISEIEFEGIDGDIKVYRDEYLVPTIVAESIRDLSFAQGYENARDRLWQLEFFKAVAIGELSKLFGQSQIEADKYLRTLGMEKAAEQAKNRLEATSPGYIDYIERYIDGVNTFIEHHPDNLPLEFTLLGIQPSKWRVVDALAIQGVLSRTLSIGSLNHELLIMDLVNGLGGEATNELLPIAHPTAEDYLMNQSVGSLSVSSETSELTKILELDRSQFIDGSNNWVIGPDKSQSGVPLLANDPHLDLSTPGIWWRVQLVAPDFHVEGFALPGVPGIIIGHNERVTWGVTNTGTDAVDLFYFKTRNEGTEYFHNGTWKEFEIDTQQIEIADGSTETFEIKRTVYGPVLDPDLFGTPEDGTYVMRWTLHEDIPEDIIVKAVLDLNMAENIEDINNALEYWVNPGQNIVYATIDGDFGYQYTGYAPIRKTPGSGIMPQNGSNPNFGWDGYVDYEDHLRVENPEKGYFATANQEIDTRHETNLSDSFYITDYYDTPYRGNRINSLIERKESITMSDMRRFQGDTKTLYGKFIMDTVRNEIESLDFTGELAETKEKAQDTILGWNHNMDRSSVGATIWGTFTEYFERYTFEDELSSVSNDLYESYISRAKHGITNILENSTSVWFDDKDTEKIEVRQDIVARAFNDAIEYLDENLGGLDDDWQWGEVHEVVFEHPIGSSQRFLGFFNEGGIPSAGAENTLKASSGTPRWDGDKIIYTQTHGPSMRYIAKVEQGWNQVEGIAPPGQSGHFGIDQRGNSVEDWVENDNHLWNFTTERSEEPTFTYRKK